MIMELVAGALFIGTTAPLLFPEETEAVKKAAILTREQMSASARSTNHPLIKGYRTQEDARRKRVRLQAGEVVYFPNGMQITTETGLKDVQVDGWWYAWDAYNKGGGVRTTSPSSSYYGPDADVFQYWAFFLHPSRT